MIRYFAVFQRPFQDLKKLTVGGVLNGLPIINLVTIILVSGYTAECAHLTLKKKDFLPVWQGWWGLFKRGFLLLLIWGIYSVPLFLLILINLFKNLDAIIKQEPTFLLNYLLKQHWGYVVGFILLFLVTWYLALLAVIYYADTYRFKDAFRLSQIVNTSLTPTYFKAWAVAFLYTLLVGVLLQALLYTLPSQNILLGIVYGIFSGYLTVITAITSVTLAAQAYSEVKSR